MSNLKRLHVAAIFVSFFKALKDFLIPLIISLFIGGTREAGGFIRFEFIWIGIIILIFITGILHWFSFRYRIENEELYVQQGIFIKKKRYIQQKRVQSIDISAGLFQRLFGLVKVKIETAGGGAEPEVSLIAISRDEAEDIRSELLRKKVVEPLIDSHDVKQDLSEKEWVEEEKVKEADYTWKLDKNQLFIAALTSSGLGLAISAVAALFSQVEQFLPETIYEQVFGFLSGSGVLLVIVIAVLIALIGWLMSFIGTVLKYGGFKIEKYGDELVISRGLVETRQLTIHITRVTAVRIVSNVFRQPFGYTAVYVESAGGGSNDEQLSTVLLPIVKKADLIKLFTEVLPDYATEHTIKAVPRRALIRFLLRVALIPFVASLFIGIFLTPLAYYGFIIALICLILGYFQYRDAGSGLNHTHLWIRYRQVSQQTVISARNKIQAAEVMISPMQKRNRLASFKFSVLSSVVGKSFTVLDLERQQAEHMRLWLSTESKREEK
ncbi:PH domain-containing protein [Halalkalibacter nanhaiisediminis]|uniref:Putative membrane protein n=1 Tax=Halalkalibacter nanhaiisediminis TaxID=688079 RepID=A0A562QQ94_9BACI|nr:PH domain-containing protein [Halalkalibacter nanhaiisediminis]TWI58931.1 putative membrane protein [Halalkalibacter nanhaiisediminis]